MENQKIKILLLMNEFITFNKKESDCCYFIKKMMNCQINCIINNNNDLVLIFYFLVFIILDRLSWLRRVFVQWV